MEKYPIQRIGNSQEAEKWLSMSEAALHTPYSAEYLSLLARKGKLSAKKVDNAWYTTKPVLEAYMQKQMLREQIQNGQLPSPKVESVALSTAPVEPLKPVRSYKDDLSDHTKSLEPAKPAAAPAHHPLELEHALEKVIDRKFFSHKPKVKRFVPTAGTLRGVFMNKTIAALAIVSIIFFTLMPVPFVFSFVESGIERVLEAVGDARTVMGFRPGTHANELLLLDKHGNIAITGRIESHVEDGIAPIVVDSRTMVENLNAEFLGGASSSDFTLAFVTANGAVTTEDVTLSGNVEVGETLLVRGATKLLSALEVDGVLGTLDEDGFTKILKVISPAEFQAAVEMMNHLKVHGSIDVGGSVVIGRGLEADIGYFNSLGVGGDFSASGDVSLGHSTSTTLYTGRLRAAVATLTELVSDSVSVGALTSTNSTSTNATSTNLYSENASFGNLDADNIDFTNLSFELGTGTAATTTDFFSTTGTFTNLFGTTAEVENLLLTGSTTLQNFTFVNATGTSATTTNIYATNAVFENLVGSEIDLTDLLFDYATGTAATTTNFFSTIGTFDSLYVNDYQQNDGTFVINSSAVTGDVFSVTDNLITDGTLIQQTLTANAGNGQTSRGQVIDLVDATTAGGGYSALAINISGSGTGSGDKLLLDLNPGGSNRVVFDDDGAFRPTTDADTNTNSLGSASFYWNSAFIDTITANSVAGTITGGDTSSNTWTIGSTEAGDTNKALIFQRNSGSGNATLEWNKGSGDERYLSVNYPFNATYTVNDSSIGTTVDLYSGLLTNNTTSGTQTLLSLVNTGTGTTETGVYINNTGTGTTGLEIAGTWTNGIVTNNNSVNIGTGGLIFGTATGTSATTTNSFTTTASSTNLFSTNFNLGAGLIGRSTTTNATTTTLFSTTASSTSLFSTSANIGSITAGLINPGFTTGSVIFQNASGLAQDNSNFFWDDSNNRLGIGTTTPDELLSLYGGTANTQLSIDANANRQAAVTFRSAGTDQWYIGRGDSDNLSESTFFIGENEGNATDAGGNSARFVIDSAGEVGIGDTTPDGKLDIAGVNSNGLFGVGAFSQQIANSTTALRFGTDSTNSYAWIQAANPGVTDNRNLVLNPSAGNVGIGDTTPDALLDVAGTLIVEGATSDFGVADTTGHVAVIHGSATGSNEGGEVQLRFAADHDSSTEGFFLDAYQDDFRIFNGGNVRMQIQGDTGNVGIGTTTPSQKLEVNGTIMSANTNGFGQLRLVDWDDVSYRATLNNDGTLLFQQSSNAFSTASTIMTLDGSNVGIGTTSPWGLLSVTNTGSGPSFVVEDSTSPDSTPFLIDASGNVGIGEASPDTRLHITSADANIFKLERTDGNNVPIQFTNTTASVYAGLSSGANFAIGTGQDLASTAQLTVQRTTGNVGIGTNDPQERLHLSGGVALFNAATVGTGADPDGGIRIVAPIASSEYNWLIGAEQNVSGAFELTPSTAVGGTTFSTPAFVIEAATSDVGIGTTNPGYQLDVQGSGSTLAQFESTSGNAFLALDAPSGSNTRLIFNENGTTIGNLGYDAGNNYFNYFNGVASPLIIEDGITTTGLLTLDSGNNVGIGGASPVSKVHIYQNGTETGTDAGLTVEQSGAGDAVVQYLLSGVRRWVTGIDNSDSDKFKISNTADVGSGTLLTIDTTGNVGIGDTTPAAHLVVGSDAGAGFANGTGDVYIQNDLEVDGTIYATTIDTTFTAGSVVFAGTNGVLTQDNSNFFWDDSSNRLGIGTPTPGETLDVLGAATVDTEVTYAFFRGGGSTQPGLRIGGNNDTAGTRYAFLQSIRPNGTASSLALNPNGGNVGIGTTTPSAKLQVYGGNTYLGSASGHNVVLNPEGAVGDTNYINFTNTRSFVGYDGSVSALRLQSGLGKPIIFAVDNATFGSGEVGRIDTAGDFGIGTTSPWGKLSVTNTGSGPSFVVEDSTSPDSTPFIIDAAGNVGIGTASMDAQSLLHVRGNVLAEANANTSGAVRNKGFHLWTDEAYGIELHNDGTGWGTALFARQDSDIRFGHYAGGATAQNTLSTKMVITSGGNVGIGTTTPGGIFEVYESDTTSTAGQTHFLFNAASGAGTNDADVFTINTGRASSADEINIFRVAGSSGDLFNIRQNGEVGIGTASPAGLLHTWSNGDNDLIVEADADNSGENDNPRVVLRQDGNLVNGIFGATDQAGVAYTGSLANAVYIEAQDVNNANTIQFVTGGDAGGSPTLGTARLTIEPGGDIGIGATNPVTYLHVDGAAAATNSFNAQPTLLVDGSIGIEGSSNPKIMLGDDAQTNDPQFEWQFVSGTPHRFRVNYVDDTITSADLFAIQSGGNVGIGDSTPDTKLEIVDTTAQLRLTHTDGVDDTTFAVDTNGDMTINLNATTGQGNLLLSDTDTFAIGGVAAGLAYNAISDSGGSSSSGLASDDDLYIEGDLEVDGTIYATTLDTTFTAGSVIFAGTNGVLSQDNSDFFWDSTNDWLGIGRTPSFALDINDGTDISPDSSASGQVRITGNAYSGFIALDGSAMSVGHNSLSRRLDLLTNETTRMSITGSGSVGIGTTTPAGPLQIWDTLDAGATSGGTIQVGASATNYLAIDDNEIQVYASGAASSGALHLNNDGGTVLVHENVDGVFAVNTDDFYVEANADVGIGTASPVYELHVHDSSTGGSIFLTNSVTGSAGTDGFGLSIDSNGFGRITNKETSSGIGFLVESTEYLRLINGNVGIFDQSPDATLEVVNDGSGYSFIVADTNDGDTTPFVIESDGQVGIGTSTPRSGYKVDIRGGDLAFDGGELIFQDAGGTTNNIEYIHLNDAGLTGINPRAVFGFFGDNALGGTVSAPTAGIAVDGIYSADVIGVGTTTPSGGLEIFGMESGSAQLVLDATTAAVPQLLLKDGNKDIAVPDGQTLQIGEWNDSTDTFTENMTILSSGNVGIGTTAPDALLHVSGGNILLDNTQRVQWENSSGTAIDVLRLDSANIFSFTSAAQGYDFENTSNTTLVRILESGEVGIGIASPAAKLDVDTGSNANGEGLRLRGTAETVEIADFYVGSLGQLVISTALTGDTQAHIEVDSEDDNYGFIIRDSNTGSTQYANLFMTDATTDYLNIVVNAAESTTGLVIDDDNQVGIGVTDPDAGLTIVATSQVASMTSNQINLRSSRAAIASGEFIGGIGFVSNDTTYTAPGTTTAAIMAIAGGTHTATNNDTDLAFYTSSGVATSTEKMRILDNGNVGIGTASPTSALTVIGSVDASVQFLGQAADTVSAPSFSWTGDTNVGMYRPTTDVIGFTAAGAEVARIQAGALDVTAGGVISDARMKIEGNGAACSGEDDGTAGIWYADVGDCSTAFFGLSSNVDGSETFQLFLGGAEAMFSRSAIYPATSGGLDLGGSSNYFADLYLNGGNINTGAALTIGDGGDNITINGGGTFIVDDAALSFNTATNDYSQITNDAYHISITPMADLAIAFDGNNNSTGDFLLIGHNGSDPDAANWEELARMQEDGYFGLGETTPNARLHIGSSTPGSIAAGEAYRSAFVSGDLEVDGTIYGSVAGTITPGGFTEGSVVFATSTGALDQDNSGLFFDSATNELGIGTAAPSAALDVIGSAEISGALTLGTDLAVANGGTGASTLTNGGILLGSGTGAITAMAVLSNGQIVVGDGTTDPVALTAFTSSTGDLIHEAGGLEADVSGYTNGLYGMLSGVTADIDTESELESALGGLDVITVTASDITSANLATILTNETGTGSVVFSTSPTLTTPNIGSATGGSLVVTGLVSSGSLTVGAGTGSGADVNFYGEGSAVLDWGNTTSLGRLTYSGNDAYILASSSLVLSSGSISSPSNTLTLSNSQAEVSGNFRIADTGTFAVGGVAVGLAYNAIADAGGVTSHALASDDDLFVEGDVEVNGTLWVDGAFTLTGGVISDATDEVDISDDLAVTGAITEAGSAVLSVANLDTCAEFAALGAIETGTCGSLVFSSSPTISSPTITGTLDAVAGDFSSTLTLSGTAANIVLGSNWLSGDGGDEGITVGSTGSVGIGRSPSETLDVGASTGDIIRSYGGFSGNSAANIGGTGSAAYFPNGLWSNAANAWIYGNVTFNGALAGATTFSSSGLISTTANNQKYFQGGDDAALYDVNVANTVGVYGEQNSAIGCIYFGSSGAHVCNSGTALTIGGNTVWHSGNDGSGSGLDADTLDGLSSGSFLTSGSAITVSTIDTGPGATEVYAMNQNVRTDSDVTFVNLTVNSCSGCGGADVAENFVVTESVEAGDVVAIAPTAEAPAESEGFALRKATSTASSMGIVATTPGLLLDNGTAILGARQLSGTYSAGEEAPIALAGRVPVKFSLENGEIEAGDYLTVSTDEPGKAAKATGAGMVIGQALTSSEESEDGKVMVYVTHFYWAGNELENLNARLAAIELNMASSSSALQISTSTPGFVASVLESMKATMVDGVVHFVKLAVESLTAKALTVGDNENPTGITIYDEATGEPFCFKIRYGSERVKEGVCGAEGEEVLGSNDQPPASNESPSSDTQTETEAATTTEPVATTTEPVTEDEEPVATTTEPVIEEPTASSTPETEVAEVEEEAETTEVADETEATDTATEPEPEPVASETTSEETES